MLLICFQSFPEVFDFPKIPYTLQGERGGGGVTSSIYVHYIITVCSLYNHYMFTICSLYNRYMFTVCKI